MAVSMIYGIPQNYLSNGTCILCVVCFTKHVVFTMGVKGLRKLFLGALKIHFPYNPSLRAGSHLGTHARAAKSEFKSEVILRECEKVSLP